MTMLRYSLGLVCAVCGLMAQTAQAQKSSSGNTVKVTATIFDSTAGIALDTRSDDYNGSGQATYTDTSNAAGTKGVSNVIFSSTGAWQFYLGNQSARKLCLTFSPVDPSTTPPVPNGCYSASTEIYSQCFDMNNNPVGWWSIAPGTSNNRCSFEVTFSNNRVKYALWMGPKDAGTGFATVSCDAGSGTACTQWTIGPALSTDPASLSTQASLFKFTNSGSMQLLGAYYNTYRATITNP